MCRRVGAFERDIWGFKVKEVVDKGKEKRVFECIVWFFFEVKD